MSSTVSGSPPTRTTYAETWRPPPEEVGARTSPVPRRRPVVYLAVVAVLVVALLSVGLGFAGWVPGWKLGGARTNPAGTDLPTVYPVTFTETGLPPGSAWSVTLNGSTQSSNGSTIQFLEPVGNYSFRLGAVPGYTPRSYSGGIEVINAPVTFTDEFAPTVPAHTEVTFDETGLPTGTPWSITLNGTDLASTGTSVRFSEPNGTYPYLVGSVSGYTPSPSSGRVSVLGLNVSTAIEYSKTLNSTPIGAALTFGLPVSGNCSTTEETDEICATVGDQLFTLTIEQSTVTFGDFEIEVRTPGELVFTNVGNGSFAIQNITGSSQAYYAVPAGGGLEMIAAWTNYSSGHDASTPLTTLMAVVIDTGILANDWVPGQGDAVVALGMGSYSGATAPVTLP
jgi:hypothetical protein